MKLRTAIKLSWAIMFIFGLLAAQAFTGATEPVELLRSAISGFVFMLAGVLCSYVLTEWAGRG